MNPSDLTWLASSARAIPHTIADDCDGKARWAIKTVLAAAELAQERGHDYFHERDVRDASERAERKIRKDNLRSLPVTYQRLYELVREIGSVNGEEMKAAYRANKMAIFDGRRREPVGWRRAWDFLKKMADYNLIEMPGETKSKEYEAVDEELEAPARSITRTSSPGMGCWPAPRSIGFGRSFASSTKSTTSPARSSSGSATS